MASVRVDGSRNSDCWWYTIEDERLGAVWLSPLLTGEADGAFRFVNLIFHDPSCESPAAMYASVALLRTADPVSMANGTIEFKVAPVGDLTWADVTERNHLKVTLDLPP